MPANLVLTELSQVDACLVRLILFDHSITGSYFGAVLVYDEDRNLSRDSGLTNPPKEKRSNEPFFTVQHDESYFGFDMSKLRQVDGHYSVILS